jgi:hypothetical protein
MTTKKELPPIKIADIQSIVASTTNKNACAIQLKSVKTIGKTHIIIAEYIKVGELLRFIDDSLID